MTDDRTRTEEAADVFPDEKRWPIFGYCETCRRVFYRPIGKFCDVPHCRGWVRHV